MEGAQGTSRLSVRNVGATRHAPRGSPARAHADDVADACPRSGALAAAQLQQEIAFFACPTSDLTGACCHLLLTAI
eukprot:2635545-Pleurochrysis_carterae.AAC.3